MLVENSIEKCHDVSKKVVLLWAELANSVCAISNLAEQSMIAIII